MSILSTSSRLIKVGQDYSAGSGISIDDYVISVTGGTGTTYSAGENVSIYEQDEQLYISSKDWTNDIANASANAYNAATAQIPEPQDLSYISSKVDDKLESTAFTNWQTGQYTTDLQTIEGQITNKLDTTAFSTVSGDFLTAAPANMATTGDIAELAQTVSETYQTKGDYLIRSDSANFYPANNPSGFITGVNLSNYYTKDETSGKEELANAFANIPVGDPEVNAYVTNNSATLNGTKSLVQSNSSTWNDITAYQSNSANYLTSVNIPESATWNEVSTTVQTNSAQWAEEVISSYTTATIEGTNAINSLNGKPLISFRTQSAQEAGVADKARYDFNGNNLADDHNSLTALNVVVQSNSAQWAEGGNIPVSNSGDLYKVEFDGVDLYGYKSTTTITSEPVYIAVSSQEINYIQHTPYPQWNNYAIQNLENWSAFDIISISSNGVQIYPPEAGDYGRVTALDVYYKASYLYDYNNNSLPDFSGYVGKITLDDLVISSYIDKPSYYDNIARCEQFRLWFSANQNEGQLNNNHYICSVGNKVQFEPRTVEGIFVIPQSALPTYQYDNTNKISAINGSAIAAGDEFPVSADEAIQYVQTNSGTIDDTVTSYQTNSGTYLTAHQSLEGYVTESGFEYNGNDLITAYNGSAFAGQGGGGDVPTGTMNVSGLEYNAVNEISGYNGSAIAQYGAEKQWLVHDDTLVHAANSAQYALGVNLSAVAQLLGIDETVLWSGSSQISTGSYIELNETPFNFDRVRIEYAHQVGWGGKHSETIPEFGKSANGKFVIGENWFRAAAGYNNMWHNLSYETFDSATNRIYHNSGFQGIVNNTAWNTNGDLPINYYKIVGIGRKS